MNYSDIDFDLLYKIFIEFLAVGFILGLIVTFVFYSIIFLFNLIKDNV